MQLPEILSNLTWSDILNTDQNSFKEFFNSTPIGLCITSETGTLLAVNPAYCRIYGYKADQLIGQHFTVVVPEEHKDHLNRLHDDFIAGKEVNELTGEWKVQNKHGELKTILANALRLESPDGKKRKITYVIDITAQKENERELIMAKEEADIANRLKSEFLANMTHELRTPMTAIMGFTEMMLDADDLSDKHKETLSIIQRSGMSLVQLVNDILDFSKIEANKLNIKQTVFSIKQTIKDTVNLLSIKAEKKNLKIKVSADDLPDYIEGDPDRVQQILVNLLGNAVKFTEYGFILVTGQVTAGIIQIHIRDTGPGIPEDKQETIFHSFEQIDSQHKNYGGTGLGLAISRKLARLLEGDLKVSSKPGDGSVFTLQLPLREVTEMKDTAESEKEKIEINTDFVGRLRILIAEDNEINQKLYTTLLTKTGAEVSIAENGEKALERLREEPFDLVLLDMHMPVLNGPDTINIIRNDAQLKDLPVIALTADSSNADKQKYLNQGCSDYIAKPFKKEDLFTKIYNTVN